MLWTASRGGRNTKIHALADAKRRLVAILVDRRRGARFSGCRSVSSTDRKKPNACSATRLTTAPNCTKNWSSAEPTRSFPTAATRNVRSASAKRPTSCAGLRTAFNRLKHFRRIARQARTKLPRLRLSCRRFRILDLMSLDLVCAARSLFPLRAVSRFWTHTGI
jgi:hypothetical protein